MIYVHVPLCRSFCTYCDFYSEIADKTLTERYTEQICREIRQRGAEIDDSVKTLYFGGGTPSVLPLSSLTRILLALEEIGHGGPYEEFTLEMNPEDLIEKGRGYLDSLKALGVNRVSLGIQSFNDDLLRWMNRRHDAARAVRAFNMVREAGFRNIGIDLIFGLSNLSDAVWEETVDKALELRPEHISCYQLTVEGQSALAKMVAEGRYTEATDEACRSQYDLLCRKLGQAGYHHYEISNFALPGFEARHNSGYWNRTPYVGFGPGAHSCRGGVRSWNDSSISHFGRTEEALSDEDIRIETLMLALRTDHGIDAAFLHENCSIPDIERLVDEGALVRTGARYRIPEDHFFTADEIIRELV